MSNAPEEKLKDSPALATILIVCIFIFFGWSSDHPWGVAGLICLVLATLLGGPELVAAFLNGRKDSTGKAAAAFGTLESMRSVLWLARILTWLGILASVVAIGWIKNGTGSDKPAELGYAGVAFSLLGLSVFAFAFSARYVRSVPVETIWLDKQIRKIVEGIFGRPHGFLVLALLLFIVGFFLQLVDLRFGPKFQPAKNSNVALYEPQVVGSKAEPAS